MARDVRRHAEAALSAVQRKETWRSECAPGKLPCPVQRLLGGLDELVAVSGGAEEVPRPFEFGCCIAVAGFVEEPPADLVPNYCLPGPGAGQAKCFFLEPGRFMPGVLPLISLSEYQQGPQPVRSGVQEFPAFADGFPGPVQDA